MITEKVRSLNGVVGSSIDRAWAAGLFDGEGCTCIQHGNGYKYLHLDIGQVHVEVLKKFHDVVGGLGKIHGPYAKSRRQPIWRYRTNGLQEAQTVIGAIWP